MSTQIIKEKSKQDGFKEVDISKFDKYLTCKYCKQAIRESEYSQHELTCSKRPNH